MKLHKIKYLYFFLFLASWLRYWQFFSISNPHIWLISPVSKFPIPKFLRPLPWGHRMSKCLSFFMAVLSHFLGLWLVERGNVILYWGYWGDWAQGRSPNISCSRKTKKIIKGWAELYHTRNQTKKIPPLNLHTAAIYVAERNFWIKKPTSLRHTAFLKGGKIRKENHKKHRLCDSFKFYYPTYG